MIRRFAIVVMLAGCIRTKVVECDDGRVCPVGTRCASVTNPDVDLCVPPEQITVCEGLEPLALCGESARCYDGVCLPAGCGNSRLDPDEVCDEGDVMFGDGCSADCRSNETCGNRIIDPGEDCDDNALDHDGCASSCRVEEPRWIAEPNRPQARLGHTVAYDSRRDRIVLFGGHPNRANEPEGTGLADTWEWDGHRWRLITPVISPSARYAHAMGYDPERGVVVIFGGRRTQALGDTWEWDGISWKHISPATSPPSREHAAMTYDSVRRRLVLVGGASSVGRYSDSWTWDGTTWTQLATTGEPPGRYAHGLTYDPRRDAIVLFGGYGTAPLGDTWELHGTSWSVKAPTASPAPRFVHAMGFDPIAGRVIVAGGQWQPYGCTSNCAAPDTWGWDGTTWTNLGSAPATIFNTLATPADGRPLFTSTNQNTYRWSGQQWNLVDNPTNGPPALRSEAVGAVDHEGHRILLYGGSAAAPINGTANDTWIWDGAWNFVPSYPNQQRRLAAMAYHATEKKFVMFGGYNTSVLGDTWTFDSAWQQQTALPAPPPRFAATMAYDAAREQIVMFGGSNPSNVTLAETWRWNRDGWTQATTPPELTARARSCMAYDPVRERIVMFGGTFVTTVPEQPTNEIWEWDGAVWTRIVPTGGPLARSACSLSWDASRQRLVLVGGKGVETPPGLDDTWEWDGIAWHELAIPGAIAPRYDHVGVSDLDGAGVLVYSGIITVGTGIAFADDTVEHLRWDDRSSPSETCTMVDIDDDSLAGCADPDCWEVCTPSCDPHVATCVAGPRCGDGTCDPLEACASCPADCDPCATRCGDRSCNSDETIATCPGDCTP